MKYCLLRGKGKFIKYNDLDGLFTKLRTKVDYVSIPDMLEDIELPHESAMGVYRLVERFTEISRSGVEPISKDILSQPLIISKSRGIGKFSAQLVLNSSGKSFSVQFRHPLLLDPNGKAGRRVKKGLGVNKSDATKVVDALNVLLLDESLWDIPSLKESLKSQPNKAIEIFLSNLEDKGN